MHTRTHAKGFTLLESIIFWTSTLEEEQWKAPKQKKKNQSSQLGEESFHLTCTWISEDIYFIFGHGLLSLFIQLLTDHHIWNNTFNCHQRVTASWQVFFKRWSVKHFYFCHQTVLTCIHTPYFSVLCCKNPDKLWNKYWQQLFSDLKRRWNDNSKARFRFAFLQHYWNEVCEELPIFQIPWYHLLQQHIQSIRNLYTFLVSANW